MQITCSKNRLFIIVLLFFFLAPLGSTAFSYEEPWSQIEARTKPITAKRKIDSKRIKSVHKKYSIPFKVILPQDYEINSTKKYGVVLLLCGASGARRGAGSEPLYFSVWCKWPRLMDNLCRNTLVKKDFEHMISDEELKNFNEKLSKDNFEDFIVVDMWHPSSSRDTDFDKFVTLELLKYLDDNYRTIPDRMFRAIDGACGGGANGLMIAFRNPEFFGAAGGMQTDLGSYPGIFKAFAENADKIKPYGMSFNLNTNRNDVCNSYEFSYKKDAAGNKIKTPAGELSKFTDMIEKAGFPLTMTVFKYCSHGYSAYRYPNGHQSMFFYSSFFKKNRETYKDKGETKNEAGKNSTPQTEEIKIK